MNIKLNDKEPIYLQIIEYIKKELIKGNLQPGQVIPSRREFAEMIQVNPNTVQRAYKEMEGMGLITTMRNSQSELTLDKKFLNSLKENYIEEKVSEFINVMQSINMSKEDIINLIDKRID